MIIDAHTHILPGIDDGSKNMETSLAILEEQKRQGVKLVFATPHYYNTRQSVDDFLCQRNDAYHRLMEEWGQTDPGICLGAEVTFWNGISYQDDIERLCIGNSNLLMLEMPFRPWSRDEFNEVRNLQEFKGMNIILAHLERFWEIKENRKYIEELVYSSFYVQINTGSFENRKVRKLLLKWIKEGVVSFLGSDCHGMNRRPPNLREGRAYIEKKLGSGLLNDIDEEAEAILRQSLKRGN